jgi:uncharacterized repeat protein (TIGR03803 family)
VEGWVLSVITMLRQYQPETLTASRVRAILTSSPSTLHTTVQKKVLEMTTSAATWLGRKSLTASFFCLAILHLFPMAEPTEAQVLTTVYAFKGVPDGESPQGSVVIDPNGNLYGTTYHGGASSNCPFGCGTIFKVDSMGTEVVLHSFDKLDGREPYTDLIMDSSENLYGTTSGGGGADYGTVFKLDVNENLTTLYSFDINVGGAGPDGGLLRDVNGNLYGTTSFGFVPTCYDGTVFKLSLSGTIQYLHCFSGIDGFWPIAGLNRDSAHLYGTTLFGGSSNEGTVFRLGKDGAETVLHSFIKGPDAEPAASVILDPQGNIYGTTRGSYTVLHCKDHGGCGSVFKLDASGNETVLHIFSGGADGSVPQAGLIRDKIGNLYGTTTRGGDFDGGTLFRISAAGQSKVLHSFAGGPFEGRGPSARLTLDAAGNLYGTTLSGGPANAGTVFKLAP